MFICLLNETNINLLIGISVGINLSVILGNEILDYKIGLLTFVAGLIIGEYPKWFKKKKS